MTPEEARAERLEHALEMGEREIEGAIDRYRADHGQAPGRLQGASFAEGADALRIERQLTLASDRAGNVAPVAEPDFPFGPYLPAGLPANPLNGRADLRIAREGDAPDGSTGWCVDLSSGEVWSNAIEGEVIQ